MELHPIDVAIVFLAGWYVGIGMVAGWWMYLEDDPWSRDDDGRAADVLASLVVAVCWGPLFVGVFIDVLTD